ncbi:hypothetical protein ACJ6WF_12920 [Streptomyces sp. MMS24-I2-30]|uniref:hypothetical protein n=1 Tax=Streptomyces sp. MMS24-I2-30 TaxID=3351564 RepID=UPI0038969160
MEAVIAVFAVLFLLCVLLGGYVTIKAVGAAKRGIDRTVTQARRTVEDHTLRAKSFAQPGPVGEVAKLRLDLRTSMRATQDTLHAGVAEDAALRESLGLFERLSAHGQELDHELKRLESEPDRATLAARMPELRRRTERITQSADALRWAALDRAQRFGEDDLDALSAQIDVEAGALRHWQRDEPIPPAASPTAPGQPGPAPSASPPWPEAPAGDGSNGPQTWSRSERSGPAGEQPRPAIKPPGGRPAHPWQKKPRPESTT